MFFESSHSLNDNEFHTATGKELDFLPHLHQSFEFFSVTQGRAYVTVDGKEYRLEPSQAVLIFPYQVHSYRSEPDAAYLLCIFSPWLVPSFYQKTKNHLPASNRFDYLLQPPLNQDNIFLQKAFAYEICGIFDRHATYTQSSGQKGELLTQLLLFIAQNYKSECLLKKAAEQVRYDYAYLSKFFKRTVGLPFHSYVNLLRLQEACRLIGTTDRSAASIAEECGFSSLRTFYREFKRYTGLSPMEYKKNCFAPGKTVFSLK